VGRNGGLGIGIGEAIRPTDSGRRSPRRLAKLHVLHAQRIESAGAGLHDGATASLYIHGASDAANSLLLLLLL